MKSIIYQFSEKMQEKSKDAFDGDFIEIPDDVEAVFGEQFTAQAGNPLTIDIFRKKNLIGDGRKLPVILVVHGGGLFMGDSRMEAGICIQLAELGYLVFSLSYRLLTEATACEEIADVCSGFIYAESVLDRFGGDRDRVYLIAESAGAFLSLYTIALHASEKIRQKLGCKKSGLKVKKLVCFSGMFYTKKMDLIGLLYPRQIFGEKLLDREFMKLMNPENPEVLDTIPPLLLVSSDKDFLKKHTLSFHEACEKANKACRLWFYEGNDELTHAFASLRPFLPKSREVIEGVAYLFTETATF